MAALSLRQNGLLFRMRPWLVCCRKCWGAAAVIFSCRCALALIISGNHLPDRQPPGVPSPDGSRVFTYYMGRYQLCSGFLPPSIVCWLFRRTICIPHDLYRLYIFELLVSLIPVCHLHVLKDVIKLIYCSWRYDDPMPSPAGRIIKVGRFIPVRRARTSPIASRSW